MTHTLPAPPLYVAPFTGVEQNVIYHGTQGGGFYPGHPPNVPDFMNYQLGSRAGLVKWTVSGVPPWLTVVPQYGSLPSSDNRVSTSASPAMRELPVGTHTADLRFNVNGNPETVERKAFVVVYPQGTTKLIVSGPRQVDFLGGEGGAFLPQSVTLKLDSGGGPVNWKLENVPPWLTASSTSGTTPSTVSFSTNATAKSLLRGFRAQYLEFWNETNYQNGVTVAATLSVAPQ